MGGVSLANWVKIDREIFPRGVDFECLKITEFNVKPGETVNKVRFRVLGINDDKKRKVKFILNNKNISISTSEWNAESDWKLLTNITGKTAGETIVTVQIEDKTLNSFKIKCINYKDVFSESDVNRLIAENNISLSLHTACIIAADKQLGKLLLDSKSFITNSSNNKANVYSAYTRIDQVNNNGFVKNFQIFNQNAFKGGGNYQPIEYNSGQENIVSNYLKNAIGSNRGFHVFYFTILNGYHVLLLVVDASDLCDVKFKIYDQLKDRGEYLSISSIDGKILEMIVNNWGGAADLTKDKTASTKFGIWKIQRK